MTKSVSKKSAADEPSAEKTTDDQAEAERRFGRTVAYGIPLAALVGAVIMGAVSGLGPSILVLVAGAIVGTVSLFWASLRTLAGEAPLPIGVVDEVVHATALDEKLDRKRMLLRALKDLENERALGKMNDADFDEVSQRYRTELKAILRAIDEDLSPFVKMANDWWAKQGARGKAASKAKIAAAKATETAEPANEDDDPDDDEVEAEADAEKPAASPQRRTCKGCETSNEIDAAFCKKCGAKMEGAADAS